MSERAPSILIVDDEEMVLTSLRSVFALQTDYQVHQAGDGKRALETMARVQVDLVISDFLMPDMNGIEFLKEAKGLQPDSVRILLTGYADKENAIKAINEVGLYHYLEKPWDNDALLNIEAVEVGKSDVEHQATRRERPRPGEELARGREGFRPPACRFCS